jgi:hypothetical protein
MHSVKAANVRDTIEGHHKMLKEAIHAQQPSHRQIFLERDLRDHSSTGDEELDVVQITIRSSSDSGCLLSSSSLRIESNQTGNIGMEQASGCARINDRFKPLCAWRIGNGKGDTHRCGHTVNVPAVPIGKYFVWNIQGEVRVKEAATQAEFSG